MSNLTKFTQISRKVVAVGRNYADHAKELGNALPSKPLLFMKVFRRSIDDTNINQMSICLASLGLYCLWSEDRDSSWLLGLAS